MTMAGMKRRHPIVNDQRPPPDPYHTLAHELTDLSNAWGKAGRIRRWFLAPAIAAKVWYRMPLIFSALIHHAEGMKAQRS